MACFTPFRPVGCVCGDTPLAFTSVYGEVMAMAATGKTFQLFRGEGIQMVRGGPTFENSVTAVAHAGKYRFCAEGSSLHAHVHHKPLWAAHHNPNLQVDITHLVAKDDLVFTVGADHRMVVWGVKDGNRLHEFNLAANRAVTAVVLPSHYTNKVLIATDDGFVRLYNFRTGQLLFAFGADGAAVSDPQPPSSFAETETVACVSVSKYKDVIAFGTSRGRVVAFHLARAEVLAEFWTHESTPVTALCFRDDRNDAELAVGTSVGEVMLWDLERQELIGVLSRTRQVRTMAEALDTPHESAVHSLYFIPGKALLITAGADNSLLQFRFDTVDGLGLLIRERRGHVGPCGVVRFYNSDLIVTGGSDRSLRMTHVFSDRASWELSQGKVGRRSRAQQLSQSLIKLPPTVGIACRPARNYDFSSIVSIHDSSAKLCGWRVDTRALDIKMEPVRTTLHSATSVALSACGNFAVVGYSSGHVVRVTLQDRTLLHFFRNPRHELRAEPSVGPKKTTTKKQQREAQEAEPLPAHTDAVKVVSVFQAADLVASAGVDGDLRLWRLSTGDLVSSLHLPSPALCICEHEAAGILCIGCADCHVRLYRCADRKIELARTFSGHSAPLTAVALSPESCRHLVSTSSDGCLCVWDIPSASCVGQYRTESPVTSLSFHPDAWFLATTHAGERGAVLWTNNLRYGLAPEVVVPTSDISSVPLLALPSHAAVDRDGDEIEPVEAELYEAPEPTAVPPVAPALAGATLSEQGSSYWGALRHLDAIKQRNAPLLPPKKANVPFFLKTSQELRPTFIVEASAAKGPSFFSSGVGDSLSASPFGSKLSDNDFDGALQWMIAASPARLDAELRCLMVDDTEVDMAASELEPLTAHNDRVMKVLLQFCAWAVDQRQACDLVQAFVAHVLETFSEPLGRRAASLRPELAILSDAQAGFRASTAALLGPALCLSSTFANAATV